MKPKVLVYIPCHNYIEYIRECLDSILNQTYSKQEVVISFNGTTDGTDEVVAKEYPMVKSVSHNPYNPTMNPGINTVLKTSDCEVYMQLGADDKMVPKFWEQVLPLFEEDTGFIRIGCYQFSEQLPEGSYWKPMPLNFPHEILEHNKIFVSSPTRRIVWEQVGGFDPTLPIFGDWDFWIKAIMIHGWKWKTLDKPMYWYRRHPKAESYNYNGSLEAPPYKAIRERWGALAKEYGVFPSSLL